eukprot:CAMPEP_0202970614 /NCGR_PEP_ID=MMETSP1396-20130829/18367_1 /ASSEMBLY_ACC=CAM_ASM_000872 /TAXON_ID= /ORGANISM="Pseudokeronopsis sp., Strain Brazil" /LENGTH=142 /DNA_ID=CAMNT_0049699237 /DNA_START=123 /DNA_END=551 /DNA_ORIENTATION=+
MGQFFKAESESEKVHAHLIEEFLIKRGEVPLTSSIEVQAPSWSKPLEVFETAHALETSHLVRLEEFAKLAKEEGDVLSTHAFTKLLDLQLESMNEYDVLLNKARAYGKFDGLYYHFDHELGKQAQKVEEANLLLSKANLGLW